MPETDGQNDIGGTVIQRSFVPRGLGVVINAATVPLNEIMPDAVVADHDDLLRNVTAEILGIPAISIIDEVQYQDLGKLVTCEWVGIRVLPTNGLGPTTTTYPKT